MERALDQIFRPLARLCMARGLRFADVAERLRLAYFQTARDAAGDGATDSRLSVMTGLQRRDVARLRSTVVPPVPGPDPLARVVALWLTRHDGAMLPRHGAGSFDALARDIRKDIHPRTLLDGLAEAGTVRFDANLVQLLKRAHVPLAGSEAQLDYLGRNVGDHLAVAVGNVLGDPPGFDLAAHYNGLSPEAVAELEALWRARMRPVLEELGARAAELQVSAPGQQRVRGGGYLFVGDEE